MKLSQASKVLVHADVLASTPLATGFPLWLPFGARLAERLDQLYLEELGRATDYLELEPPLLVEQAGYVSRMSQSFDYTNMFSITWGDDSYLVRPDNLVEATRVMGRENTRLPLVMQGSLYRSETGSLQPLVRDRHIWRTIQVVQRLDPGEADALCDLHFRVFAEFLEQIGLPSLYVESEPLRNHSQRRLLTFACPSEDELTLTGTLYRLALPLVKTLGLDGELLDFGFTAKLLAVVAATHADEAGLILPSGLAPDAVVVSAKTPADLAVAEKLAAEIRPVVRVAVDTHAWHRSLRMQRRRGTPLVILADNEHGHQLIRRLDGTSVPLPQNLAAAVQTALREHDRELTRRAKQILDKALASETVVQLSEKRAEDTTDWNALGQVIGVGELPGDAGHYLERPWLFAKRKRLY